MFERTGELEGRSLDYFGIFDAYTRAGYRFKILGPGGKAPGALSLLEQADAVLRDYHSEGGAIPATLRPLRDMIDRVQGIPDPRYREHQIRAVHRLAKGGLTHPGKERIDRWIDTLDKADDPARNLTKAALKQWSDSLDLKISDPHIATAADVFLVLNRSRTFGLHGMRSIRHVTQSSFTVLPRVGPAAFSRAFVELLDVGKAEQILLRAQASGAITPAFVHEYTNARRGLLTKVEKLSFMYSKLDLWERMLSYRAGEIRGQEALAKFNSRTTMNQAEKEALFEHESRLSMLHPSQRAYVMEHLKRGNGARAVREYARLLVHHSIFDYSRANQPYWAGNIWGRLFGQYGRWPLNMIENMTILSTQGSRLQRMEAGALYAAAATTVYGLGQLFGVKTAEWIPFIHSVGYTGGPALSLAQDAHEVLSGQPFAQDEFKSNYKNDPVSAMLAFPVRFLIPGGDVMEALAADLNFTRRQRRLFGLPRRSFSSGESIRRVLGFRPITDSPKHTQMVKEFFSSPFEPVGKIIRETINPPPRFQTPLSPYARPSTPLPPVSTYGPLPLASTPEKAR